MIDLPEYVDGLPNIAGHEDEIAKALKAAAGQEVYRPESRVDFARIKSAAAIALHMHQPLIPAGGHDLRTAKIISNLKYMMDNQGIGDNHNAGVFVWCYKRMGEFIPQLVHEGKEPRVMLEYSGTLLHGLRDMGEHHVIDALKTITVNPDYRRCAEWLGCPWGHAVAPSTPVQDFPLHVRAWQHHFAAIFGIEALQRVRGFSPSEMALPNQPDIAYAYVKTLRDCGFTWVLLQEHTIEQPENGHGPEQKHLPHRLVVRSSKGETAEIIALIKTQGSDTKLVAQMQPFYEAKSLSRWTLAGHSVPPLVTQIADGENGGVMMNEFPGKFMECVHEASHSETPLMNGTEYLEHLFASGIKPGELPVVQPIFQKRIWDRMKPGDGPDKLAKVIEECKKEDHRFHMDGGSWTNNISWVQGYENVLAPMDKASSQFFEKVLSRKKLKTDDKDYRNALYHLLSAETSCYRYWGQGIWTDYGAEMARRAHDIVSNDF
ncbi:MAG: hypothetical protein U1E42_08610 [Rhodospirillales bacterium]